MLGSFFGRSSSATSLIALAIASIPTIAAAQDQPATQDEAATQEERLAQAATQASNDQQIVITGSRIPRANFDTSQRAVVLGSEQIEQRGYTNLADALEELPAFGVPGSTGVGNGQGGPFGSGQNFVNFFGLGDQRTLTLVNGRQFVTSNTASIFGPSAGGPGGQVDFNNLPTCSSAGRDGRRRRRSDLRLGRHRRHGQRHPEARLRRHPDRRQLRHLGTRRCA